MRYNIRLTSIVQHEWHKRNKAQNNNTKAIDEY